MQTMLRRHLLALMLGVTTVTLSTAFLLDSSALAKSGSDDHGSDDSGGDSGGSSGNGSSGSGGGGDDSGGDSSGDDSDSDNNDSSGIDDDGDSGDNGSDDDSSGDDKSSKEMDKDSSRNAARQSATITLTPENLSQVRAGTHQVVDQLGRPLEIRVTNIAGVQVIRAKPHGGDARRRPGPITTITVVPNSAAPGNDDGTPDQGSGDN